MVGIRDAELLTFDLQEAAECLKLHPEELRRRAKAGSIPGAKVGRAWVFLVEDLIGFLRSKYAFGIQISPRINHHKEASQCRSLGGEMSGTLTSQRQVEVALDAVLKHPTAKRPRSTTTKSGLKRGRRTS
jgi:hypothetical protein